MPALLHVHSWYSLLEGTASPASLVRLAREGGYSALALTDTNNLYGVVPFVESASRAGIRPLVGAHLELGGQQAVALAADTAGYRNLCKLISKIADSKQCRGNGRGPAPPPDLQSTICNRQSTEGIHWLVGDPGLIGPMHRLMRGRLWVEVVRPGPGRRERELLECAAELKLPVVASTAAYLGRPEDLVAHRLVTAVKRLTLLDRTPATLPVTPERRALPAEELRQRYRDLPQAVENTDRLAEMLRSDVLPRETVLPAPVAGRHLDFVEHLRALCERGLRERGVGGPVARKRLRDELKIIEATDLPGYFLTVRDIARAARKRGHTLALRGSAGNSLVCYLLGITDVDPLRFGLELERFLHPGRANLPDIDLDFDWKVRDEMIDHVVQRYGQAHVARVSAHLFYQPQSAFREASKVHGLSNEQVSELLTTLDGRIDSMLIPAGKVLTMPDCPRGFPLEPGRWPRLIDDARRLLGRPMHPALHPGGIVITPEPVDGYVPVQWAAKGALMTQFDKDGVKAIGLVKIDLLGNRALSTVDEARQYARAPVPPAVECDRDEKTLSLLRAGDTVGIGQLESPAVRHLLVQIRPRGLEDVIQALALVRPGAASVGFKGRFIRRRHGNEAVPPAHPSIEAVLKDTHGLMVYDDDPLRVIQGLTGLSAAEADHFRKRISKREGDEELEGLYREFVGMCAGQGLQAHELSELWLQLAKFDRYSFCKSHSVSYGLIAWQAAYLKAHHPLAFWSAALNNNLGTYPNRVYIEAIKRGKIEIRPPCLNRSHLTFRPEDGAIRVGLEAVAGLPAAERFALLQDRRDNGPFRGLAGLKRRVPVGARALGALIRVGALDFTGLSRPLLFLEAEVGARRQAGDELFAHDPAEGWVPPACPPERQWWDQWRLLGFVLGPPLYELFRPRISPKGPPLVASREVPRHAGRVVRVQGLVATARRTHTEAGKPLQFVTLEDEHGLTEVALFEGTCRQVPYLTIGPYVVTGVVENHFGSCAIRATSFSPCAR